MWSTSKRTKEINEHKEALLRQLSHSVKDIQWVFTQTGQVYTTQESVTSLLTIIEAIFLHGLKQNLLQSALRSVATVDDKRPSPQFYDVVKPYTHKDTTRQIQNFSQITNEVGRCRVWIRLALNDSLLSSYFSNLHTDRLRLSKFYNAYAFLRDREVLDTAKRLLDGLVGIPFEIPPNSSLLNNWPTEPLLISGFWTPATRASVQTAVDVASSLADEETSSLFTASSARSLLSLDESQALRMILDTPLKEAQDPSSDSVENNHYITPEYHRTYSALLLSCSPCEEDDDNVNEEDLLQSTAEVGEKECEEAPEDASQSDYDEPLKKEEDFGAIFEEQAAEKQRRDSYGNLDLNKDKTDKEAEEEQWKSLSIEEQVYQVSQEANLRDQKFECADCKVSIGLAFGEARLCHLTGSYLCSSCHFNEYQAIPARVIFNWDHKKYPIGQRAATFLSDHLHEPIFNLHHLNPQLTHVIPELRTLIQTRRQLNLLHIYLETCRETTPVLELPRHLLESSHVFTFAELLKVPTGALESELQTVKAQARAHVVKCWMCSQRGFICEVCQDQSVIYPFDGEHIYRCVKCKAVYHGKCLTSHRNCRKCKRRKERFEKTQQHDEGLL